MAIRKRWLYFILILITIPLGAGSREIILPGWLQTNAGDVLAATCIFFGVRFIAINKKLTSVAVVSYIICIAIETLQLYQAPWIVQLRSNYITGTLLGHGFLWSDWLWYAIGVVIGACIGFYLEKLFTKKCSSNTK